MTLEEGKRKVLMILDEYSSGGDVTVDQDINNKMSALFDMAQKDIISLKGIIRQTEITLGSGEQSAGFRVYDLPSDFKSFFRIWKNGRRVTSYPVINNKLCTGMDEGGKILVEYFAWPVTITPETPDTYEFEVAEDAANCLPFYVAAQQIITDLVIDYSAIWNMYLQHKAAIDVSLPSGGSSGVINTFFRR